MRDTNVRRASRWHRRLFKWSGGLLGSRLVDNDILLLTTQGRHSGRLHTVPLLYLSEGEELVVVASFGGRPTHPEWYLNLSKTPQVVVQIGRRRLDGMAKTLCGSAYDVWWARAVEAYAGYATYQSRTERKIPLVSIKTLD